MYFDTHLLAADSPRLICPRREGAIVFGSPAHEQLNGAIFAESQSSLIPRDNCTAVLDLQLSGPLIDFLKRPKSDWFPLLESVRQRRQFLRFKLPAESNVCLGLRRLAQHFNHARFLIDPFQHGPQSDWQAQVRLAECENIWLTTLGLMPCKTCRWQNPDEIGDAFHFTMGEVGASKLLFASGFAWDDSEISNFDPQKWLDGFKSLDEDQRALILQINARELFGSLSE